MNRKYNERGQALILIALAAIGLFGFAALAIDGSRVFSDRRHAQNAVDAAAMAAALAYAREDDMNAAAVARATSNGYDGGATSDVTVTATDAPAGVCPANTNGRDITVTISSTVNTTIARVIGRSTVTNLVRATSRSCGSYIGPPFNGNAIVSLAPTGKGFDGTGNPDWVITGGGIFANSSSSDAAYCNGAADISAPSVTVVGGITFSCHGTIIPTRDDNATQYAFSDYSDLFPRQPACNGTATLSGGKYRPQAGADGSRITFTSGDMDFAPGLYCIMNANIGPYHGKLTGTGVTFYVPSTTFTMKFNGSGNSFNATAPTSGEFKGILMYMAPKLDANGNLLLSSQALDLRGNGLQDTIGTIIAPSAAITLFGNSSTSARLNSQIIAYTVNSGGNSNIVLNYSPNNNYQAALPITLTLLR